MEDVSLDGREIATEAALDDAHEREQRALGAALGAGLALHGLYQRKAFHHFVLLCFLGRPHAANPTLDVSFYHP